jgi:hypothetical protein
VEQEESSKELWVNIREASRLIFFVSDEMLVPDLPRGRDRWIGRDLDIDEYYKKYDLL